MGLSGYQRHWNVICLTLRMVYPHILSLRHRASHMLNTQPCPNKWTDKRIQGLYNNKHAVSNCESIVWLGEHHLLAQLLYENPVTAETFQFNFVFQLPILYSPKCHPNRALQPCSLYSPSINDVFRNCLEMTQWGKHSELLSIGFILRNVHIKLR